MVIRRWLGIIGLVMLMAGYSQAQINSKAGTAGLPVLKIGIGARAAAMGETFCGVADDISALYWNPAGLKQVESESIALSHTHWFEGIKYGFLGWVYPVDQQKTFGFSLAYLDGGEFEGYDNNDHSIGQIASKDFVLTGIYAHSLLKELTVGISLKVVQQRLEREKAGSLLLDLSLFYQPEVKNLSIGLLIQNLGPGVKFVADKAKAPLNCKLGLAYRMLEDQLLLALDLNKPIDNDLRANLGFEYQATESFCLRFGYNSGLEPDKGFSLGFGLNLGPYQLDYGFVPYGNLGNTQPISLGIKF